MIHWILLLLLMELMDMDEVRGRRVFATENFTPPRKDTARKGMYTGAHRPPYPPVFRKCGNKTTREFVVGKRPTGMNHYGYERGIVGFKSVPPIIPRDNALASRGCPSILAHVPQLKSGPKHWLFDQ